MKKLFAALIALSSTAVFAATTVPIQLITPIAANTAMVNATGSTATPTAFAMPSCSTSGSALNWTTSTGFTCNASVNAAQLGGQTFTSPTITTPTITGVTSGACAAAGNIGECKNSNVPSGSAISVTTATATNVTSVSLTAGNWLCYGNVAFTPNPTTVVTLYQGFINTVSGALPTSPNSGSYTSLVIPSQTQPQDQLPVGMIMENVTSTTTVYLEVYSAFTTSAMLAYGYINCVRWH